MYTVDGKNFINKIEAIIFANKTLSDITWDYHDNILKKIDWTVEPSISLDELYKNRAIQLRERYDYIVILCSGGADSTNVAKTFLNNDIPIDEIVASIPEEGIKNYVFNDKDKRHYNTISEIKYAQFPLLHEIKTNYPRQKITVNDYFQKMLNLSPEEWIFQSGDFIHPTTIARYNFDNLKHIRDLAEQGKKIAFIYGIEKPLVAINNKGNVGLGISDLSINTPRQPFSDNYLSVENVCFYTSIDCVQLMIKQAHTVIKWFLDPKNLSFKKYLLDFRLESHRSDKENRKRHSVYERAIVPCIYPSTHRSVFQAEKPESIFFAEHDYWFYKDHGNTLASQMMMSDFKSLMTKIDKKYLVDSGTGFKTFVKWYKIGTADSFVQKV